MMSARAWQGAVVFWVPPICQLQCTLKWKKVGLFSKKSRPRARIQLWGLALHHSLPLRQNLEKLYKRGASLSTGKDIAGHSRCPSCLWLIELCVPPAPSVPSLASLMPLCVGRGKRVAVRDCWVQHLDTTWELPGKWRNESPTFCLIVIYQRTSCPQRHRADLRVPPSCIHSVQSEPVAGQENRALGCEFREGPGQSTQGGTKTHREVVVENTQAAGKWLGKQNDNYKAFTEHQLSPGHFPLNLLIDRYASLESLGIITYISLVRKLRLRLCFHGLIDSYWGTEQPRCRAWDVNPSAVL